MDRCNNRLVAPRSFSRAQDVPNEGFADALAEIRSGAKTRSLDLVRVSAALRTRLIEPVARYGLRGIDEAAEYLNHPVLRGRLMEIATAVAEQFREGASLAR